MRINYIQLESLLGVEEKNASDNTPARFVRVDLKGKTQQPETSFPLLLIYEAIVQAGEAGNSYCILKLFKTPESCLGVDLVTFHVH